MIGQKTLLGRIHNLIQENKFPKFVILTGQKGSGRHELWKCIKDELGGTCLNFGTSVSDVRQSIVEANKIKGTTVICTFFDADNMSVQAKNALLKIVEEPPKNVYYIMTLENISNTLPTIKSRGVEFQMQAYTPTEIGEYAKKYRFTSDEMSVVADICETPGEVETLHNDGVLAFDEYVRTVVEHIATVSGANCFNIANRIKFKDEDNGFDLRLFLKSFMVQCSHRMQEDVFRYARAIQVTSKALQELGVTGIVKQNVFDMWILNVRAEWLD